jgi:putative transposase
VPVQCRFWIQLRPWLTGRPWSRLNGAMARRPRNLLDGGAFHVTARAGGGLALFEDDIDRSSFIALLGQTAARLRWICHAYCLMTTHYHLLVETNQHSLSTGMHRLNGVYAQGFNRRHARKGHLFEQRFSAYVVDTDEHLEAACSYILDNPVRAGLCDRAEEWPWSGGLVRLDAVMRAAWGTVPR